MIEKSRLEELIEQGATIYEVKYNNINPVSLTNKIRFISDRNKVIVFEPIPREKYKHYKYFDKLFETLEEAEWHKEFGCIERIERLELPTWEEFKNKKIKCVCFTGKSTNCLYEMFIDKKDRIQLYDHDCEYYYFNKKATKENYTLACRKAKELFLGEKENVR